MLVGGLWEDGPIHLVGNKMCKIALSDQKQKTYKAVLEVQKLDISTILTLSDFT